LLLVLLAAGCATTTDSSLEEAAGPPILATPGPKEQTQQRGGGYYKDDGPGDSAPANLASIPDAVPKDEPPHRYANRPYTVFGIGYTPISTARGYKERGTASWYGKKFHGQKTSGGEIYDMYAMTGAHKTLPIPSYAKVTNLGNGKSVVVRINDRGPFHSERLIDLSYAAAFKLGYVSAGSARVEVESIAAGGAATDSKPAAQTSGVYVQVGAFSSRQNAEDFRARIARQLAWLTDTVQVLSIGNLWRLHVGPYGSGDAARAIAERIEAELNLKPLVVTR
jgi:rare lipoprotein A